MIGNETLRIQLQEQIKKGTLPSFIIIAGESGSGKYTMVKELFTTFTLINIDTKVDSIRNMLSLVNTQAKNIVFVIRHGEDMSLGAINALLKVTEETPKGVRIVLTCRDENRLLNTIISRGTVYKMLPYTKKDLELFLNTLTQRNSLLLDVCSTPGQMIELMNYDLKEFYKYVELVVDNVALVSGSNSFKIGEKINLKNTEDKYDLGLFFRLFINVCQKRLMSDTEYYSVGIQVTSKYLSDLTNITGINKTMLFDTWVLEIRREWMSFANS